MYVDNKNTGKISNTVSVMKLTKDGGNTHNRTACQLQPPKNAGTVLQKATLVDRTGNLTKSYPAFVIKMTLKAHTCVLMLTPHFPLPPLHQNTHGTLNTHMHSHHTDASDHYGLLFCQTSDSAFLPLADNRVRGDFFFSHLPHFFGKGSDKLHSGVLKCQLKMKINNLGVGKRFGDTANINPTPGQTWYGPGGRAGDWQVGQAESHSRGGVSLFERQEL